MTQKQGFNFIIQEEKIRMIKEVSRRTGRIKRSFPEKRSSWPAACESP
jgi:hypothetical protein